MKKSRRQFLGLMAAASAAAIAGTSSRSVAAEAVKAVAARRAARAPAATPAGAIRAEINRQKAQTATSLRTIRDYPLAAGSPMAFAFKPLKAARGRKAR